MRTLVLVPVLPDNRKRVAARMPDSAARPPTQPPPTPLRSTDDRLAEAVGLAEAIGLDVADQYIVTLTRRTPATLFGSGKVNEFKSIIEAQGIGLVIVDGLVSPGQQRNLERAWSAKVLDRTGLILEIFGQRARTREGRLQVELAHLTYQKSRLVRTWTHLERQRGGYGFLGGPGETQIETDRRLIQERIVAIRKDLVKVVRTRTLHRASRKRVPYPVVAIVGYTNAGKSTLFNSLTGANVDARDQVFATLDPTMREVVLPSGRRIILSDTVGFISDLPTTLVAAFRATLEEVIEANLIVHLRDISHAETATQRDDVDKVLADLGIDGGAGSERMLEVWNKIDLLDESARVELQLAANRLDDTPVLTSAATGSGLEAVLEIIDTRLSVHEEVLNIKVPVEQGGLLSWLHENTTMLDITTDDVGTALCTVRIDAERKGRLLGRLQRAGVGHATGGSRTTNPVAAGTSSR